jgi:tRNA nucleotidyltransferase (CCA-adding enzyme)
VLHARSFVDDPTRLLRLARYSARLGFEAEAQTAELAEQALAAGALGTISRSRVGAELRLALGEEDALAALRSLSKLGVLSAIEPAIVLDEALARCALSLLPSDGRRDLLLMASLLLALGESRDGDVERIVFELLDGLEFSAGERERIMRSALIARSLARRIAHAQKPSQLREALFAQPLEAVALAGASSADGGEEVSAKAADWLEHLRHVRLAITGDDLLRAGVRSGPELGRRLDIALARKLDGELQGGAEPELAAALEAHV